MSVTRSDRYGLAVDAVLADFIDAQVLPETGISADRFWGGFAAMLAELTPINRALLAKRDDLQAQIDAWHIARRGQGHDAAAYQDFLREIGYLLPEGDDFQIETTGVDAEIAEIAGPQLVVPITNARYALNAANARWGSLYDALYGTDAMGDLPSGAGFDAVRGARAIAYGRAHLDKVAPLDGISWTDVRVLAVTNGVFTADGFGLKTPAQFAGHLSDDMCPLQVLLRAHGLLIEILVDPKSTIGAQDQAGISDIYIESALSAIMDLEDSVACVDGADKAQAYGNWLGLMRGDLAESVTKGGKTFTRALNPDQTYIAPDGSALRVKCRARMLIRNVGHLMTNPAILLPDGSEVFEGLMDAMITATIGLYDLRKSANLRNSDELRNSDTGAMYVVKPKMHGPDEVAFACQTFERVEAILGMAPNTVKLGIMDEERRTSANLKACIRAAKSRVAFINTGFLDRTGDETHTSMQAGAMLPKGEMKAAAWIKSYEDRNVDIGLAAGFSGRAQIGKGMWAMPDLMAAMGVQKIAHPQAGANCAWVPSPTAATLHALHYHLVDVFAVQAKLAKGGARADLGGLLTIPLAGARNWDAAEVARELDNNAQGILGYVVRWVDQGIGCSKVPDINNIGLMEDRATCRISAQAIANWLLHGIVTEGEVRSALAKMAVVVDAQNAHDTAYRAMAPALNGAAYRAACDLVFHGAVQPSGYTEPLLHAARLLLKTAR
jgi:malate synthase